MDVKHKTLGIVLQTEVELDAFERYKDDVAITCKDSHGQIRKFLKSFLEPGEGYVREKKKKPAKKSPSLIIPEETPQFDPEAVEEGMAEEKHPEDALEDILEKKHPEDLPEDVEPEMKEGTESDET